MVRRATELACLDVLLEVVSRVRGDVALAAVKNAKGQCVAFKASWFVATLDGGYDVMGTGTTLAEAIARANGEARKKTKGAA